MTKIFQKYACLFVASLLLLALVVVIFCQTDSPDIEFFLVNDQGDVKIETYVAEDGITYVFLPSYADLALLKISKPQKKTVFIGETLVEDGMFCEQFELETKYDLFANGRSISKLCFYKSANVATVYIDTVSGTMEHIHQDKEHSEYASVAIYTPDGNLDASDHSATIKGRGNATWVVEKKPYALTLSADLSLLGMNPASDWILLANAYDETNLNNKLVYDLAQQLGFHWTPNTAYVDVYLNGSYNGLYLLAEKVEVSDARLNIGDSREDFLCKIDLNERWDSLKNPFLTNGNRTVEVVYPKNPSQEQHDGISTLTNQLENVILSGADLTQVQEFDLDSWVKKYLIDEISANIDADFASSYFYCYNGVFYAGPIWDYDMALGNSWRNQSSTSFHAAKVLPSNISTDSATYYGKLYSNKAFFNRMVEIYRQEFLPILEPLLDGGIEKLAAEIKAASTINSLRWRTLYANNQELQRKELLPISKSSDDLIAYLKERITFLNSAWLEGVEYCTIHSQIYNEWSLYVNLSIKKGEIIDSDLIPYNTDTWINQITGEKVDFSRPITTDLLLCRESNTPTTAETPSTGFETRHLITFMCIGALLFLLSIFVFIDIWRRKQERTGNDGYEKY